MANRLRCPACQVELDAHVQTTVDVDDDRPPVPGPGDHVICAGCGAVLALDDTSTPHVATATELAALPDTERADIAKARQLAAAYLLGRVVGAVRRARDN